MPFSSHTMRTTRTKVDCGIPMVSTFGMLASRPRLGEIASREWRLLAGDCVEIRNHPAGARAGPALVHLDRADRVGLARVLRAIFAPLPRGADAADEIDFGVVAVRQRHRDLAGTDIGGAQNTRFS